MVKDLPNTFMKKTDEFWKILRQYSEEGCAPLVFILTDTNSKSLNIAFNLFPDNIRSEIKVDTIYFNPVSTTMMKRGIKRIVQMIESDNKYKMQFIRPADDTIDSLIEQCQGDIRNAVLNLNFASQLSNFKLTLPKVVKKTKNDKKAKSETSKDDIGLGKNEALTLMHGLGRVFHPKLELNHSTKFMQLTHQPENLTDIFSSQPANFIKMIHSNYIKNFSDIHDVSQVTDMLSIADCFESEYRDERLLNLNLNLVIRSAMVLNQTPASGFRTISAYANKKWKKKQEVHNEKFIKGSKLLNNGNMMARNDYFCDYYHYLNVIK